MADFDNAYNHTMAIEGGYANHPSDTGGETYKGIARNHWPTWKGWERVDLVKNMTGNTGTINYTLANDGHVQILVQEFYKDNFWDVNRLDAVKSQIIAEEIFDTGVNIGVGTAARMLQEALNLCNKNGRSYPDIVIDGKIGPATLSTLNNSANSRVIFKTLNLLQGERYLDIMRRNKSQEVFWEGWLKRILLE